MEPSGAAGGPPDRRSLHETRDAWRFTPALFGVVVLLFMLPFVTVECAGQGIATLRGIDLVAGTSIRSPGSDGLGFDTTESQQVESEPLAVLALVAAVVGIVLGLWKASRQSMAPVAIGLAGVALLIALKVKIDQDVRSEGEGLFGVSYGIGYWLSLAAFVAAAATAAIGRRAATGPPPTPPSPPQLPDTRARGGGEEAGVSDPGDVPVADDPSAPSSGFEPESPTEQADERVGITPDAEPPTPNVRSAPPDPRVCGSCGTVNPASYQFCDRCGARLAE